MIAATGLFEKKKTNGGGYESVLVRYYDFSVYDVPTFQYRELDRTMR